ncbi:hypothetical protein [Drancourtella massiliensis]|uniref:hypothetical protein n=1 Tax=Drancourtella massiliensis TaxID=1632013 RepID=UPI001A9C87F6|nr:hypothetical protein [Drancourtella massiliensis]
MRSFCPSSCGGKSGNYWKNRRHIKAVCFPVLIHHQEVSSFFSSYIPGANVWIASNVTILPGVTIGDHSIIGAGSVVTKDIPPNVIAFGHPAEVHREITEEDEIFYDHGKRISEHIVLDIHG